MSGLRRAVRACIRDDKGSWQPPLCAGCLQEIPSAEALLMEKLAASRVGVGSRGGSRSWAAAASAGHEVQVVLTQRLGDVLRVGERESYRNKHGFHGTLL